MSVVQELKPKHKKHIVETLLSGSSKIDPYDTASQKQPEEEYIMMRKFGLILLKDIVKDKDSLVCREFAQYLKPGDEQTIRDKFKANAHLIDNDINISIDQTKRLQAAIRADATLKYPPHNADGSFDPDVVRDFLIRLGEIFDWKRYEYNTLGKCDEDGDYTKLNQLLRRIRLIRHFLGKCDEDGDYTKLRWYAVILAQWMEGKGLNRIMWRAVSYQERHPDKFWINKYTKTDYIASLLDHRNIVFANTLEVIENIILFSISNYFLRFSTEYKKIHGEDSLATGNWYEYVEYGTTNEIAIQLQRHGFSRESATYIRDDQEKYIIVQDDGTIRIRWEEIQKCTDSEVQRELPDVHFNTTELFIKESDTQEV